MISIPRLPARIIAVLLIVAACIAGYANSFTVPFIFDDNYNIVENPNIRDFSRIVDTDKAFRFSAKTHTGGGDYFRLYRSRIVAFATFAADYHLWGLDPRGFHATNLLIHIASSLLLFSLVLTLLRTPFFSGVPPSPAHTIAAAIAGLLFAVHPVQTQAVTYLNQRVASLATLFCLASLCCYLVARIRRERLGRFDMAAVTGSVLAVLAAVLAMRTKEIAITLPLVVMAAELLFFTAPLKRRILYLAPLLLTMLIIPVDALTYESGSGAALDIASRGDATPRLVYLANELVVIVTTYLRLLFVPAGQHLDYQNLGYRSLFEPAVMLSAAVIAAMIASAFVCIRRSRTGTPYLRLAGFGILFFFLGLSTESSVLPIVEQINEHRLYLPSSGFFLAIASAFLLVADRPPLRAAMLAFVGCAIIVLAIATYQRNEVWQSEEGIWLESATRSPRNARAHANAAAKAYARGDVATAQARYESALAFRPDYDTALTGLGTIHYLAGRLREARHLYERSLLSGVATPETLYNLAVVTQRLGDDPAALQLFQTLLDGLPPENATMAPKIMERMASIRSRMARR